MEKLLWSIGCKASTKERTRKDSSGNYFSIENKIQDIFKYPNLKEK